MQEFTRGKLFFCEKSCKASRFREALQSLAVIRQDDGMVIFRCYSDLSHRQKPHRMNIQEECDTYGDQNFAPYGQLLFIDLD